MDHSKFSGDLLFAALITLLVACGDGEQAMEQYVEDQAAEQGVELEFESDNRLGGAGWRAEGDFGSITTQVGEGASIPADFPADVPIYPGLKITTSHRVSQDSGFFLQGLTGDDLSEVVAYYQGAVPDQGWTKESETQVGQMRMSGYKKERRMFNLSIISAAEGTTVQITTADAG